MELEIDLPNYLYDKPDDYYADDVIKNRDETIESLKKDSKILKDRLHIFSNFRQFDGDITLFSDPMPLKCEIKFIPKKFSVMSHMGRIYKTLTCDVVLKNVSFNNNTIYNIFKDPEFKSISEVFKKQFKSRNGNWEREFRKIAKLIGMEDYGLRMDDIIFEFDE